MALLALTSPAVSDDFKDALESFYFTRLPDERPPRLCPERPFNAFAGLYTSQFEEACHQRFSPDVLYLAEAVNTGLFSRTSLVDRPPNTSNRSSRDEMILSVYADTIRASNRAKKLNKAHQLMNAWVYEENAVVVPCGFYVSVLVLTFIILVLGGLATGLTVGEHIKAWIHLTSPYLSGFWQLSCY